MRPERSGLQSWHQVDCAWCDAKAKGDALHVVQGEAVDWFASCGKHGSDYKAFGS